MTPKQRKEHLESIHEALINAGWVQDNYGHYKKDDYRMKMAKTSMRYEWKNNGRWVNIHSDYFKNIKVSERQRFLIIKERKIRL